MGRSSAEPRKGFDHWVSFRGQGQYFDPTFNVNGETVEREGYMTDLITEYALDWLKNRENPDKPFFLYVSHKAVHHGFRPAPRHEGEYSDVTIDYPETMADTEENYAGKPEWLEEQRDSMHGGTGFSTATWSLTTCTAAAARRCWPWTKASEPSSTTSTRPA
jgi:N-acetylglucosamine-6-sulfatase